MAARVTPIPWESGGSGCIRLLQLQLSASIPPTTEPPHSHFTLPPPSVTLSVSLISFSMATVHFNFYKFTLNSHFYPPGSLQMSISHLLSSFSFLLLFAPPFACCCLADAFRRVPPPPRRLYLLLVRSSAVRAHAACISEASLSAGACTRSVRLSA